MEKQLYRSTGTSLILGSLLITATMVLHPVGGNVEHILSVSKNLMATHSIALFSVSILLFGFYGLTHMLEDRNKISLLAFIMMALGLIAAMFAALVNGLVLPLFLGHYSDTIAEDISLLKIFITYNFTLNTALDYVFITACCLAIAIYSILIMSSHNIQKWLGYFGALIIVFILTGITLGFAFTSLTGFRIFVFSLAGWVLSAGVLLLKSK